MEDLKKTIMQALLLACRVDHDDADLMSQAIEDGILAKFSVVPKLRGDFTAELNRLQQAVLKGEDVAQELCTIAEQIDEAIVASRPEGTSFEQMET